MNAINEVEPTLCNCKGLTCTSQPDAYLKLLASGYSAADQLWTESRVSQVFLICERGRQVACVSLWVAQKAPGFGTLLGGSGCQKPACRLAPKTTDSVQPAAFFHASVRVRNQIKHGKEEEMLIG